MLELLDPSGKLPGSLEGRCRLCGLRTEYGQTVQPGRSFGGVDEVIGALQVWSLGDGEPDVLLFTQVNMAGLTPAEVARRVLRGDRVETSFDVIAFLFPQAASGSGLQPDDRKPEIRAVNAVAPMPSFPDVPEYTQRAFEPLDVARALVSVMVADGVVRASEKAFLARMLQEFKAPALVEGDYRVWRPQELGIPEDPKRLFEVMRLMCLVDREVDGTEVRILQEYSRAWGVPLDMAQLDRPGAIRMFANSVLRLFVR